MEVRTFIKSDGASVHFFEVTWDGLCVELAEGPAGSDGEISTYEFRSVEELVEFIKEAIGKRLAAGFQEHEGEMPPSGLGVVEARNPELEVAITRDFDSVEPYLIYGDWLDGQGDPRGQLIAIHHRILEGGATNELRNAHYQLLQSYPDHFVGDLDLFKNSVGLDWHLGFIRGADVTLTKVRRREGLRVESIVRDVLNHSSARFLQHLKVGFTDAQRESFSTFDSIVTALEETGPHPYLHTITLGEAGKESAFYHVSSLETLRSACPALRRLHLHIMRVEIPKDLQFPGVADLELGSLHLQYPELTFFLTGTYPNIERLHVGLSDTSGVIDTDSEVFQPLVDTSRFPALRHLSVTTQGRNTSLFLERLVNSPGMVAQLESLRFFQTRVPDAALELHEPTLSQIKKVEVTPPEREDYDDDYYEDEDEQYEQPVGSYYDIADE